MEMIVGLFLIAILALPVIFLIVFIAKVNELSRKVTWLENELLKIRTAGSTPLPRESAQFPPLPGVSVTRRIETEFKIPSPTSAPHENNPPPPPTTTIAQPASPHYEKRPSRTREEWEALIGGKLLNRIGAVALIIGVGFFLKYAFDNNWITETMRVAIGAIIGAGLLFFGARFHKKNLHVFAQGLNGAGIAILYLSAYASFNFYHLVSQVVAFALMSAVTGITFFYAFRCNSLAIALLGWAGGYLTPFLLSTGQANETGLFTYIAFLEAGLLAIVLARDSWLILELLALGGTSLTYFLWHQQYYNDDALALTVIFLSLFWGLFYLSDLYKTVKGNTITNDAHQVTNIFTAGLYYGAMYSLIEPYHHNVMGAITIAIALVYVIPAVFVFLRESSESEHLAVYVLMVISLLILATAIQLSGFVTVILWAIEAFLLIWCALRWNFRYVWQAGMTLFAVAVLKLFFTEGTFTYAPLDQFSLIMNKRLLAFIGLAATMMLSAILFQRSERQSKEIFSRLLHATWCILMFIAVTVETNDFFRQRMTGQTDTQQLSLDYAKMMTLICVWIFYSLPLVLAGLRKNAITITVCGFIVVAVAIILGFIRGIAFIPIENFRPILNLRFLAVMSVIAGSCVHLMLLKQHQQRYDWIREVYGTLLVSLVLLLLSLLSGETRDVFERQLFFHSQGMQGENTPVVLKSLENLKQLSLSGLWLLYGIVLMIVGIWRRVRGLRVLAIILLGVAILKIFVYDLSFLETLYRIFSFMGLGLVLLMASYLYQRFKSLILEGGALEERKEAARV